MALIKSVLNSLSLYYFWVFKASKGVIGKLEQIRRNFLCDRKKMAEVSWNTVCKPKARDF